MKFYRTAKLIMMLLNNHRRLLTLCWVLLPLKLFALPTDFQQDVYITADNSKTAAKQGIQTHSGNVFLQQGSLKINSDELVIHYKEKQLQSFVATGSPTKFQQQLEMDQEPVKASGEKFELSYSGDDQLLIISGDAKLQNINSTVTCDKIIYNLTTGDFEFDKNNSNTQCEMNFQPAQNVPALPLPSDASSRPE